ncbi:family 43 glycosylhydrolase [Draconibacterium mangrovi]|uniref:family 43 glycosylhydrolase n=1 Tax=Draconibacterium mangrovi TaxID=2697469 RepID=UPI0013D372C6|nr:family 43 glycosylhydrolase [Draconibacterium mangrovi]
MGHKKVLLGMLFFSLYFLAAAQDNSVQNNTNQFTNPLFAGDYPDPSILRNGEDYYLVHSSFYYYPGLLIWHSTDLINWAPVANALHTNVGSVWAPELTKYGDKYYIYFPADNKNYVITSENIEGPWTEPVLIDISMIDPGHVVDEKGNRYLYFSSGSYVPLTDDGLTVAGDPVHSYDGWEIPREWSIECFCMEGPKLFKRGEYYYLTVAEGGTAGPATGHMVISARSKSPLGPWENSPYNPILRAQSNKDKWWSVAHGTVFDDVDGNWFMIFHGYENGFYNMGRQTMLTPVEWTEDGWYKIPDDIDIAKPMTLPGKANVAQQPMKLSDDFSGDELDPQWKFFGGFEEGRFEIKDNSIVINGKGHGIADCSPMLTIPADHAYTADVEVEIEGDAIGGMVMFYNQQASSGILADDVNILSNLRGWQFATEQNVINRHVFLRLKSVDNTVDMYYSLDGKDWIKTENSFETTGLNHNVLSGFLSLRIGLCSIGDGKVTFKNFQYKPLR